MVAVCLLGAGCGPPTRVIQGPDRPNIILILTDDLDARLLEVHMEDYPNLRELAAEGTTFENAFVTDSLCCPSRTSILRGQYAHGIRVASFAEGRIGYREWARRSGKLADIHSMDDCLDHDIDELMA